MGFVELLQDKLGEHIPGEIEELILDGLFTVEESLSEEQKTGLEKYSSLIHLCMNGLGFKNLKNFPSLPKLQILEISENKIDGKDLDVLVKLFPALYKIKMANNKIESIDALKGLKEAKELKKIEVLGNPFVEKDGNYSKTIFEMLSTLEVVDGKDKNDEEVESTIYDDEGEEFEDDGEDDEEFDEEDDEEEFEEDEDDEDDDDEDEKPKKTKKH